MGNVRVVHYINQFFAQLGGEDTASSGIQVYERPLGPGIGIAQALGDRGEIVATIVCGDNHIAENLDTVTGEILDIIRSYEPDLFFAGPAFNAGRYGVACGSLCKAVKERLKIPAVTGMYRENPGVDLYAPDLFILRTEDSARKMRAVLPRMVEFAFKLRENRLSYDREEEGFHERGWLRIKRMDKSAAERAVDMLLDKLHGRPVASEIYLPVKEDVPRPQPIEDLSRATVVLITDGGLYPADNPDKMAPASSKTFHPYSFKGEEYLKREDYTVIHNGFDTSFLREDPNRVIPVDAMRVLEKRGVAKLHEAFLSTTGLTTNVTDSTAIGRGMVDYIRNHAIDAAILTST